MFKWRHLRPLYIKESIWLFECMVIKKLSRLYKTYCGDIYATFARGWRALEQSVNAEVRSLKLSLNILKHPIVVTKPNSKKNSQRYHIAQPDISQVRLTRQRQCTACTEFKKCTQSYNSKYVSYGSECCKIAFDHTYNGIVSNIPSFCEYWNIVNIRYIIRMYIDFMSSRDFVKQQFNHLPSFPVSPICQA